MAVSITVDIPDALVGDLVQALALRMGVEVPVTPAGKIQLARDFMKTQAKQALLDWRAAEAARVARQNTGDAGTW